MKQLIVLVASVVLGVTIGGIVLGFGGTAEQLNATAQTGLGKIAQSISTSAIEAQTYLPK